MNHLAKPGALCLLFPHFLHLLVGWAPQGQGSVREHGPEFRAGSGSGDVVLSWEAALLGAPLSWDFAKSPACSFIQQTCIGHLLCGQVLF